MSITARLLFGGGLLALTVNLAHAGDPIPGVDVNLKCAPRQYCTNGKSSGTVKNPVPTKLQQQEKGRFKMKSEIFDRWGMKKRVGDNENARPKSSKKTIGGTKRNDALTDGLMIIR